MEKIKLKAVLLPKFETGIIAGNEMSEAGFFRKKYFTDPHIYKINGTADPLYVQDGIALMACGMGKVNTAASVTALFCDSRFDFSDALILGIGCGAGACGRSVMGDVCVVSEICDLDLGHRTDIREMEDKNARLTWFHDNNYDEMSHYMLNGKLAGDAYALIKDLQLETTDMTKCKMAESFDGEEWAARDPKVLMGTAVTSDNYWKGRYDHDNAEYACGFYGTKDPFVVSEMEDSALANVCRRFDLIDHLLILRDIVNMDVYLKGTTPESLWHPVNGKGDELIAAEEVLDIFETAQLNNTKAGSIILDAWLDGKLSI